MSRMIMGRKNCFLTQKKRWSLQRKSVIWEEKKYRQVLFDQKSLRLRKGMEMPKFLQEIQASNFKIERIWVITGRET